MANSIVSDEFTALEQRNEAAMETFLALPRWRVFARHRAFRHWQQAEAEFGVVLKREHPWTDSAPPLAERSVPMPPPTPLPHVGSGGALR